MQGGGKCNKFTHVGYHLSEMSNATLKVSSQSLPLVVW